MRQLSVFWIAVFAVHLAMPALAQSTGYTTPSPFMNLFFDFTGSDEPGYPAGQPTLGQMLIQSVIAEEPRVTTPPPLILIIGSDIYVYNSGSGARLGHEQFRADLSSGFFEMTAISHRSGARLPGTNQGKR